MVALDELAEPEVPVESVVLPVEPVVLVDVFLVESVDVEAVGSVDAAGWVAVFVAVGSAVAVAVAVGVGAVVVAVGAVVVSVAGATAVVDTVVVGGDCGCVAVHC